MGGMRSRDAALCPSLPMPLAMQHSHTQENPPKFGDVYRYNQCTPSGIPLV